ncbi:membrane protein insertion efficiency factor YidD [Pleurocapsales cyanobacterium LEGE 06147]|nr:membrane protein insertion efficiency factor YidD [Pleurocapsales cyanobacterium LEGE 06147]
MSVSTMESFASRVALVSLNSYQKHLSPRKGFSCPHRLLYGSESCSDYVKDILINHDLKTAIQMAPQRFKSCKIAAQTLQTQKGGGGCIVIPCCIPI